MISPTITSLQIDLGLHFLASKQAMMVTTSSTEMVAYWMLKKYTFQQYFIVNVQN